MNEHAVTAGEELPAGGRELRVIDAPHVAPTPMMMLQAALDKGVSVEQMGQLLALQERWEANEARKAYVVAMTAFKANPPEVLKRKAVAFGNTAYKHALLEDASAIIGEALSQHGISHRWDVEQADAKVKVTCILTHALGHSESVTLEGALDTSGSKNPIQSLGSTVSYLQRYSLFAASGIAPKGVDDDATDKGAKEMDERVRIDFLAAIDALSHSKDVDALWQTIAAECTKSGDIPAYDELKVAMAKKAKALKAAA